ncbi:MAG: indolepyruvate oxidoreductase subunit beta [Slackia piriformis]|uniref:Indolepyruvate oxidoreductase subunit beta n=1 Tax=Slackia piriformis TaxID=626934 RepID=A0A943YVU3_9ACTN|nr:indolepyruvate oxidoreductase subunit beta [Slackia piriformis]
MSNNATTVLLCGVGGQGALLAADILARCAMTCGQEAKLSEIHGMAQRGGAVTTVVRFGESVSSMVADLGSVDYLVSFETTEALRNISYVREGGVQIVSDESIKPLPVLTGRLAMPAKARKRLKDAGATVIPAELLAKQAGSIKAVNVVLLGALSTYLSFPEDVWIDTIAQRVPAKFKDVNIAAFRAARAWMARECEKEA